MKSQQFNNLFLPKTEKNAEKMFILEKKKNNNTNNNQSTSFIQSFLTVKAPNLGPYQDTTNTISRRDGRNESQTAKFNFLQYIVCSFAKWPSCRVTVRLNGMLYSRILLLLSDRLIVENSFIWIAVLRKQVDFLTVYLSCMRHLHINYFFPTFVVLAAFVCHYFQSTLSTKGNELFNNSIEMKYSGDNFEAV